MDQDITGHTRQQNKTTALLSEVFLLLASFPAFLWIPNFALSSADLGNLSSTWRQTFIRIDRGQGGSKLHFGSILPPLSDWGLHRASRPGVKNPVPSLARSERGGVGLSSAIPFPSVFHFSFCHPHTNWAELCPDAVTTFLWQLNEVNLGRHLSWPPSWW